MSEGCSNTNRVQCGGTWITVQDIEKHYGKHRKEAAAIFNVSESTFRRKYNELGINSWPYPKRNPSPRLKSKVQSALHSSSSKTKRASSNRESCNTSEEMSPPPQMEETSSTSNRKNDVLIRHAIDDNDGVDHMGAQPSPENTKLLFHDLMALTLENISDPDNETSMNKALSILENNLTLFSKEQADQILELSFGFPTLVRNWREYYSRSQTYSSLKLLEETEKIRDMVKRDEESLKERYEELEKKEQELMTQLAAVKKEKEEVAQQRIQKSKETQDLMEKAAHRNKDERLTRIATAKLKNLSEQWAELQSSFL